ncbi:MAG: O-antigen ligase family protein [Thermoanaerobaculia bacterium]
MTRHIPAESRQYARSPVRGFGGPYRRLMANLGTAPGFVIWLGMNAGLAFLMQWRPTAATLHAGLVVMGALVVGISGTRSSVLTLAAYIAGTEILWRMAGAGTPWLLGEYALILLLGLGLLRWRRRPPLIGLLYLLPLLVSVPLTFDAISNLEQARQAMAFNLAGPVALFMAFWFATTMSQHRVDPQMALLTFLGPAFGVATLALQSLVSAEAVEFTNASNFVASGGFGPNQVASVLSLGLLFVLLQRFMVKWRGPRRWVLSGLAIFLAFQTALTFSRSGLAMTVGAFAVTLALAFRRRRQRLAVLTSGTVMACLFALVLVPGLERVTHGSFSQRYTNPSLTGRETIAKTDLQIWQENPVLGVGPGVATRMRTSLMGQRVAGHTEFTRMLAEHGVFGLVSLVALVSILAQLVLRSGRFYLGPAAAGIAVWVILYMAVNAFRLALPAFGIGLAVILMASTRSGPGPMFRMAPGRSPRA